MFHVVTCLSRESFLGTYKRVLVKHSVKFHSSLRALIYKNCVNNLALSYFHAYTYFYVCYR